LLQSHPEEDEANKGKILMLKRMNETKISIKSPSSSINNITAEAVILFRMETASPMKANKPKLTQSKTLGGSRRPKLLDDLDGDKAHSGDEAKREMSNDGSE
jgi:hypothetical protein